MDNPRKILRERALVSGFGALSDSELLLLLMDDATLSEVDAVLGRMGGLRGVCSADMRELRKCEGVGLHAAVRLGAGVELGRRTAKLTAEQIEFVGSSEDVVRMFVSLNDLSYEEFWVVYLNSAGRVLERQRVSQGGVSSTQVDCRLVVKRALELLATNVVLVHNHPSGVAVASDDDVTLTERLRRALELLDIALTDHLIIAGAESFSFREKGLL
ncbi:MAG: DNA repair protein RadC [Rikenellaceae bacterium]|nr:DNA repair protein RadC [Rikenellaceae bacterium]